MTRKLLQEMPSYSKQATSNSGRESWRKILFWKQLSKLGLALEHSETKSEVLGKKANTNREVRRLHDLEEEVARLKMEAKQPQEKDKK